MRKVLLICVLLLVVGFPTTAQEETQPLNCEIETIAVFLEAIQEDIAEALELYEDDPAAALNIITDLSSSADLIYAQCHGLEFEGDSDRVLGPVMFPDGFFRATVTTEGYFIAEIVPVSGTCETARFGGLFNVSSGDATNGAESLLTTEGCTALIQTSIVNAPWTLTFDNILPAQSK